MGLALFLFVGVVASVPPSVEVYLAPSAETPALSALLRSEESGVKLTTTASRAQIRVDLEDDGARQLLVVTHRSGVRLVERALDLSRDGHAAVRVASILILRAAALSGPAVVPFAVAGPSEPRIAAPPPMRTSTSTRQATQVAASLPPGPPAAPKRSPPPLETQPVPPPPAARESTPEPFVDSGADNRPLPVLPWVIDAGTGAQYWADANTAQLKLRLAVAYRFEGWRLGAALGATGLCCGAGSGAVTGRSLDLAGWIEGGVRLLRRSVVAWDIEGGVGVRYARITAQAQVFEGPGPEQDFASTGFLGRLGTAARIDLADRWSVIGAGGIRLVAPRLRARLPSSFSGAPLDEGAWAPWIEVRLEFHAF